MKEFLRTFAANLSALLFVLGGLIFMVLVILAVSTGEDRPTVPSKAVLIVDLTRPISDKPPGSDPDRILREAVLGGSRKPNMLRNIMESLRIAADDDRIAAVLLRGPLARDGYQSGWAALRELRGGLARFKESGKSIHSYSLYYDEPHYYLASLADTVNVHPLGAVELNGLASERMFYANALKKYGVGVRVLRVGKFKSAVEPYVLDKMSDEARAQTQSLLADIFNEFLGAVEHSRGLSRETLLGIVNEKVVLKASDALESQLVDRVAYFDEIRKELQDLTATRDGHDFAGIGIDNYLKATRGSGEGRSRNRIAVIYAEGSIVDGSSKTEIGGDTLAALLRQAREEDRVKAVVLRVNSPGGSATASEVIQREARLIQKEGKPFVVSMGTVAASGGYWISAYADEIVAQPNTITGSIGVFGLIPNVKKLINDFGVTVDSVKTNRHSDIGSIFRPMTDREAEILQVFTDQIYAQFLAKVSEGRRLDLETVHAIGQGRVWSGIQAKQLGLVDTLGGLEDAIAAAARLADIQDDFRLRFYQREKELQDVLLEMLSDDNTSIGSNPLGREWLRFSQIIRQIKNLNDPRGVYARLPHDIFIH